MSMRSGQRISWAKWSAGQRAFATSLSSPSLRLRPAHGPNSASVLTGPTTLLLTRTAWTRLANRRTTRLLHEQVGVGFVVVVPASQAGVRLVEEGFGAIPLDVAVAKHDFELSAVT